MKPFIAVSAWLLSASIAQGADWQIVPDESHLQFSGTHVGRGFTGEFSQWSGDIRFDPDASEESKIRIEVDTSSAATGDKTYDGTLPKPDWFDVESEAMASFVSRKMSLKDDRKTWVIDGLLSIRGIEMPVLLSGVILIDGDRATFLGNTVVNRMDYDIGADSDAKGEYVSLQIPLDIKVVAVKKAD